jgi:hypothetical protein
MSEIVNGLRLDHAAVPNGFARSIRRRSRGLFIAAHKSLRR